MNRGLDINACAEAIFIRARYLVAIEDGRFDDLPDPAYVTGFVRAYADHLGVDLDGFAQPDRELPVQRAPEHTGRPVYLQVSRTRTRARGGGGVAWASWLALLVIVGTLLLLLALWLGVFDTAGMPA